MIGVEWCCVPAPFHRCSPHPSLLMINLVSNAGTGDRREAERTGQRLAVQSHPALAAILDWRVSALGLGLLGCQCHRLGAFPRSREGKVLLAPVCRSHSAYSGTLGLIEPCKGSWKSVRRAAVFSGTVWLTQMSNETARCHGVAETCAAENAATQPQ